MATYYSNQEIADLAKQTLPVKYTNLESKAQEYQTAVFREIVYGYFLADMQQVNQGIVPFNITRIRKQLGRYGKGGKGYWWDWLHANFPLVNITSKGNSIKGVSSMAQPQIPLDIILASGNGKELVEAIYNQYSDADFDLAPINTYSLENYILATTAENSLNETIQNNLKDARMILAIARECKGKLPQVINYSAFGRTYYKGVNLQNVHKTVRHAALGACYSVDIDSAVFNWKYSVVPFRDELSYTRELIRDKTRVRKHLAQLVFGNTTTRSIKTVKQVLTAISFGARAETKCWFKRDNRWTQGSISEIIYSKELRDTLFQDDWMKQFMREQDKINKFISDDLANAVSQGDIPEEYLKDLRSERGRISKGKLIAWAYQQTEQQVMSAILEYSRSEVILQVHDGVYFKTKPDMPSMQTVLQDHWPLATLSIEEIDNYHYRNRELDQEHLDFIKQEEIKANNGVDPNTTGIHTETLAVKKYDCHSEPNWEKYINEQMEEYYAHFPEDKPLDLNMPDFVKQILRK
jgi:hypothetical protein